jgi:predicted alpha/beta-hydrolase family hydrolase
MKHIVNGLPGARVLCLLAHGAGAGIRHPFMESIAAALAERGIASLRYEFAYMEEGRKRVDAPAVATARVREAARLAGRLAPGLPLIAGGKSFGGRMTSTAQAAEPLPGVRGLVFLGFPLHPPGRPGIARADHLDSVAIPMLFVQGTRDEFATGDLLTRVLERLGPRAACHPLEGGDHSFRVRGRKPGDVVTELAGAVAAAIVDWGVS